VSSAGGGSDCRADMSVKRRRLRDSKRLRMMEEWVLYFRHWDGESL
jgi:hypothetical protein